MVDKIKLDHDKENVHKAFGISKERRDELAELIVKALTETSQSKIVETVWNSLELSNERAYALYRAGNLHGKNIPGELGMLIALLALMSKLSLSDGLKKEKDLYEELLSKLKER